MEKDEKVDAELAKRFDYLPLRLKRFEAFLQTVKEFAQYVGSNQYYSDGLNKKILLLNIEVDEMLLDYEELTMRQDAFKEELQKAAITKRKAKINEKEFAGFKNEVKAFEEKASALHGKASAVIRQIKEECKTKNA